MLVKINRDDTAGGGLVGYTVCNAVRGNLNLERAVLSLVGDIKDVQ